MTTQQLADLSQFLLWPCVTVALVIAMFLHVHAMAFSIERDTGTPWSASLATVTTWVALVLHVGHLVTRSLAAGGRVPWGNMFEFSSTAAALMIAATLWLGRDQAAKRMQPFFILAALLTLGAGAVLWSEPGPLQPILNSEWLKIHVLTVVVGFATFSVGAVLSSLHLLRAHAEQRARATATRSLGAASATTLESGSDVIDVTDQVAPHHVAWRMIAIASALAFIAGLVFVTTSPIATVGLAAAVAFGGVLARHFVAQLPDAAVIERTAHRVITFGFPIWTFAIIAGAIWAEQSWGRYWGWDPKETSAFLTWVAYAGYLHGRATRGISKVRSSQIAVGAFGVLWFTYFVVNLFITGLHSYGGLQ